eukprot:scaffold74718_cov24-Attheya_sp.AAC.1
MLGYDVDVRLLRIVTHMAASLRTIDAVIDLCSRSRQGPINGGPNRTERSTQSIRAAVESIRYQ